MLPSSARTQLFWFNEELTRPSHRISSPTLQLSPRACLTSMEVYQRTTTPLLPCRTSVNVVVCGGWTSLTAKLCRVAAPRKPSPHFVTGGATSKQRPIPRSQQIRLLIAWLWQRRSWIDGRMHDCPDLYVAIVVLIELLPVSQRLWKQSRTSTGQLHRGRASSEQTCTQFFLAKPA